MNKTSKDRSQPVHFSTREPVYFSITGSVYQAISRVFVIFILMVSFSCDDNGKREIKPENVIDRETMIMLLADMDVTDAALKTRQIGLSHDSIRKISAMAYDSLYIYYNITPKVFRDNMRYYQRDMEDYQKMIDEKIILLTKRKDSLTLAPEKLDTSIYNQASVKAKPVTIGKDSLKGKPRK